MPRSLLLTLLALLALSLLTSVRAPDREPTPCTTCGGEGRAVQPCAHCGGDGKAPCGDCALPDDREARLWEIYAIVLPPDELAAVRAKAEEQTSVEQLAETLEHERGYYGGAPIPPGFVRCPARCVDGTSFVNKGHACKVCDEGRLKCRRCKGKGETRCSRCDGSKKLVALCRECGGHGTARDPLARTTDARTCPWCADERVRECLGCDAEKREVQVCRRCDGDGKRTCERCAGTRTAFCAKCDGTGDLSAFLSLSKRSNECDPCKTRGVHPCDDCRLGRVDCEPCEGRGRLLSVCTACVGTKAAPCEGCWDGATEAWRVTALRLLAAGRAAEACAHQEVVLERTAALHARRLAAFLGDERERARLERELARELADLRKILDRMRDEE